VQSCPVPPAPPRLRCGDLWALPCGAWVGPPDWAHDQHPSPLGKIRAAARPGTPEPVLQLLAGDPDPGVRWAVAARPACPPGVLQALARDPDQRVRARAQRGLAAPQPPAPRLHLLG